MFRNNYNDKKMSLNELEKMIDYIPNVYKNELLELIYVLKAWELISKGYEIKDENLKYYKFIKSKIEIEELAETWFAVRNQPFPRCTAELSDTATTLVSAVFSGF